MSWGANHRYGAKPHNYTMMQGFEWYLGGDAQHWKNLEKELPRLEKIGITAIWIPPPYKASGKNSVGYDTYDLWDMGEFQQKAATATKYGTKEDLMSLVKKAASLGVVMYIDAVLNHKFGADRTEVFNVIEVDQNDRTKDISGVYEIEGWTGFDFPGRKGKYSDFKWNFNHFTGVDYNARNSKSSIYRIVGENKGWALGVDSENSNYDYLMGADIDHAHEEAAKDICNWGTWVCNEFGHVGFRFDAVKHIDANFIKRFVEYVRKTTGKELFCVGEFWKDSLSDLEAYLGRLGVQFSVFDTPLHYNFKEAGEAGGNYDLRKIWDNTLVKNRPLDAVTLVDNHDTQVGQSLESWVSSWFKPLAYAMILLRVDGYPCIFWGDLYGCGGDNPQKPVSQLDDIIKARKHFAYGEIRDYWDFASCVGWVRTGDKDHDGCAVIVCNGDDEGKKWMEAGKEHAGETWIDLLGWTKDEITVNQDGWAEFKCPSKSVGIWIKKDARGSHEFKQSQTV